MRGRPWPAAGAELALDFVAAGESSSETAQVVAHIKRQILHLKQRLGIGFTSEHEPKANYRGERAVDRPSGLAGHEAAGNDVDSLKKPDATDDNE